MMPESHEKTAVLVGLLLPDMSQADLDSSLAELSRLVTTLGYRVVGQVTQKRNTTRNATLLGEGKLKELAERTGGTGTVGNSVNRVKSKAELKRDAEAEELAGEDEPEPEGDYDAESNEDRDEQVAARDATPDEKAHVVIIDCDLSPSQLRNLESATGVTVFDRTGVIIEIFSRHARSRAARLQVEIARLTYLAPRLRETGGSSERIGGKGSGETSVELDRRKIRDRIKELKEELDLVGDEQDVRRARREKEITVALVGYTNAGKSSLMRALTGSEVLVADKLFATLDTTIRPLYPETKPKVLVSDTVGFIKKLPHDLVASFKSTLDEALNASLLLFVVDASDPAFRSQLVVTQEVLAEVGAGDVPRVLVMNKRDRLTAIEIKDIQREFEGSVFISTRNKEDVSMLRDKIVSYFESDMVEKDLFIPYMAKGMIGEVRGRSRVLKESFTDKGTQFRLRATEETFNYLSRKLKESE